MQDVLDHTLDGKEPWNHKWVRRWRTLLDFIHEIVASSSMVLLATAGTILTIQGTSGGQFFESWPILRWVCIFCLAVGIDVSGPLALAWADEAEAAGEERAGWQVWIARCMMVLAIITLTVESSISSHKDLPVAYVWISNALRAVVCFGYPYITYKVKERQKRAKKLGIENKRIEALKKQHDSEITRLKNQIETQDKNMANAADEMMKLKTAHQSLVTETEKLKSTTKQYQSQMNETETAKATETEKLKVQLQLQQGETEKLKNQLHTLKTENETLKMKDTEIEKLKAETSRLKAENEKMKLETRETQAFKAPDTTPLPSISQFKAPAPRGSKYQIAKDWTTNYLNSNNGVIPGVEEVAASTGVSVGTVSRARNDAIAEFQNLSQNSEVEISTGELVAV